MSVTGEVKGGQGHQRLKNDRDGVKSLGFGQVKRKKSIQKLKHSINTQVQGRIVTKEGGDSTGQFTEK